MALKCYCHVISKQYWSANMSIWCMHVALAVSSMILLWLIVCPWPSYCGQYLSVCQYKRCGLLHFCSSWSVRLSHSPTQTYRQSNNKELNIASFLYHHVSFVSHRRHYFQVQCYLKQIIDKRECVLLRAFERWQN